MDDLGQNVVKIRFEDAAFDIWLCTDNVFQVKHVEKKSDSTKFKRPCFSFNSCDHIKKS